MIHLDADCQRRDGVTFVRARVTNDRGTAQEVHLRSTLDGPTWAPDSDPIASTAWTDGTWSRVLSPGRTRGLGFATPAEPGEDPLEIVSVRRASEPEDPSDAETVLSDLEASAPPTDVISRQS